MKITIAQFKSALNNKKVVTEKDLKLLQIHYSLADCKATPVQLSVSLGYKDPGAANLQFGKLARRITEMVNPNIKNDGSFEWWTKIAIGKSKNGSFAWALRRELVMAMEELNLTDEFKIAEELPQNKKFYEGAKKAVFVNVYERNKEARDLCIAHHGNECLVCEFDFEKKYGPVGKNFIHVHHIIPIATIQERYMVDPIKDLIPVCANCHSIIHTQETPYTIEEMKTFIKRAKS